MVVASLYCPHLLATDMVMILEVSLGIAIQAALLVSITDTWSLLLQALEVKGLPLVPVNIAL